MNELWIKFRDQSGEERRVQIAKSQFVIGRHSTSDLSVADSRLSRQHLEIKRLGEKYLVSDLGSSNGTELNGQPLSGPSEIKDGDRANLGGGLEVEFQIETDEAPNDFEEEFDEETDLEEPTVPEPAGVAAAGVPAIAAPAPSGGMSWLILAPVLGVFLLIFAVGIIYFVSRGSSLEVANNGGFTYSDPDRDDDGPSKTKTPSNSTSTSTTPDNSSTTNGNGGPQPSPSNVGGNSKVEQAAAAFLRRIAQNDPNAFLTADQSKKVSDKIKQIGTGSLADNISSARKSASQLKAIATAKNLTPQFLATAAMLKLGSSRGDVLQTAQSMAEVLGKLQIEVGSERADDCLLMIAAYDQGQAGDFLKLRNMLQDLATKFPESSRDIRTIWFLQKNSKITDGEFDFALRFLAIGTITQSPKDFGVNVEPLTL
jgi:pSer/pThr/pTyr-binding forkhead associated (FHA) protein